jgi:hypothetical protein
MDIIAEAIRWTGLARQWTTMAFENTPKKWFSFINEDGNCLGWHLQEKDSEDGGNVRG